MKNFALFNRGTVYPVLNPVAKLVFTGILFITCSFNAWSQYDEPGPETGIAGIVSNKTFTAPGTALAVIITQQPQAAIVCEGSDTSFTVAATGGGPLTYQWQESTDGGTGWSNISDGGVYSGAGSATLVITGALFSMDTYMYRCNVSDGAITTSNAVSLTVNPGPTVQTGNVAQSICANGGGTLTATVFPNLTYQWQVSTDGGSGFSDVTDGPSYSGSATSSLSISNAAGFDGFIYRYSATNTLTGCSATSTGVDTLHVNFINTASVPPPLTATCAGSNTSMAVSASGNGTLAYQWKLFPSNVNVTDGPVYSGSTTSTLTFNNPPTSLNNTRYTLTITNNGTCPVVTGPFLLQVRTLTAINTQPANDSICATDNAVFSVSAVGSSLSYQWQTDNGSGGSSWSDIPGGSTLTLTNVPVSMSGFRYRVNVNGNCGAVLSSEVILSVRSSGTWLGAVDTNWHVPGNWCGGVPISTTDVLIPNWAPRMPTISNTTGTAFFQSLTIENNARLEINGGTIDNMAGPFDIMGTVAYTAVTDQQVFPAPHGSLEINGSGNKSLLTSVDITNNMMLGGTAKLVTGNNFLTMLDGSNPISGATMVGVVTSWIVTGNGAAGAANTGLGGLRVEQMGIANGSVLFPVGPTSASYNPIEVTNNGTTDDITVAVNDQRIPGSLYLFGIDRTWLVSEATPGGSNVVLLMRWGGSEEQTDFDRTISEVIRSDGSTIVQNSATSSAFGGDPFLRGDGSFNVLSQFSVASFVFALPVKLTAFRAKKINADVEVSWEVDKQFAALLYTVQKSTDGIHFNDIGQIKGEENKTSYRFIDNNPAGKVIYYRLKMTGTGGETIIGPVVQVTNNGIAGVRVELRPSVTGGVTGLYISSRQQERIVLTLTDVTGRIYIQQNRTVQPGDQLLPLDITRLKSGLYYLHINGNRGMHKTLPVIRQ